MRDPLRPIPSPTGDPAYWEKGAPPPAPRRGSPENHDYDPLRLLRGRRGDAHGLDRRCGQRGAPVDSEASGLRVVASGHRELKRVVALCTTGGWALVQTISIAPAGVLIRSVDILDRSLDARTRRDANQALAALSPVLGAPWRPRSTPSPSRATYPNHPASPLANVGTMVLGQRVVADVAAWATASASRISGHARGNLAVTLVIPPAGHRRRAHAGQLARVEGELAPLNDPNPSVLAVALESSALASLKLALR